VQDSPKFENGKPLFAEQLNQLSDLTWQTRLLAINDIGTGLAVAHNSSVDTLNNCFYFDPTTSNFTIKKLNLISSNSLLLVADELSENVPSSADMIYLSWKNLTNECDINNLNIKIIYVKNEDIGTSCLKIGEIDRSTDEPKLRIIIPVISMDASTELCRLHEQFITLLDGFVRDVSKSKRGEVSHRYSVLETANMFIDHCWNVSSSVWIRHARATIRALYGFIMQNSPNLIEVTRPSFQMLLLDKPYTLDSLINYIKEFTAILADNSDIRQWLRDFASDTNEFTLTDIKHSHIGSMLYEFKLNNLTNSTLFVVIEGIEGRPYNVYYSFDDDVSLKTLIFSEYASNKFNAEVHLETISLSKITFSVPKPGRPRVLRTQNGILH
jgi:hypothetical protein